MSIINSCVLIIKEFDNIIKSVKSGQEDRESKLVKLEVLETQMTSDQNLQSFSIFMRLHMYMSTESDMKLFSI